MDDDSRSDDGGYRHATIEHPLPFTVVSTQYDGYKCGQGLHFIGVILKPVVDGGAIVTVAYATEGNINTPFDMRRRHYQPGDVVVCKTRAKQIGIWCIQVIDASSHMRNGLHVQYKTDAMQPGGLSLLCGDMFHDRWCHYHSKSHLSLCLVVAHNEMTGEVYKYPHAMVYEAYWRMQFIANSYAAYALNASSATIQLCDVHNSKAWLGPPMHPGWAQFDVPRVMRDHVNAQLPLSHYAVFT